jgi:mono/diheme cytochrome c family protein
MVQLNWSGSKRNLIYQTISAGRPGTLMPTWSQEFGGSMEPYQIGQVTDFVMNWGENPELCGVEAQPTAEPLPPFAELPEGDPANGEVLYNTTYACAGCHGDPNVAGTNEVGPWLGNIAAEGDERVEGLSAGEYIHQSILEPNAFIAPICANDAPCSEPSTMPDNFGERMSAQDLADVIAFLLSFGG